MVTVARSQQAVLNRLISNTTLTKLIAAEALDGAKAYKVTDFFADMNNSIFREVKNKQAIDLYRRNLQKMYVQELIDMVNPAPAPAATQTTARRATPTTPSLNPMQTDVVSVAKGELRNIQSQIKAAAAGQTDSLSNYHLLDLADRIDQALNPNG